MKKVFITGITGQDGIFLTKEILENDPETIIVGATRNTNTDLFYNNLINLNLNDFSKISLKNINLLDFQEVNNLITDLEPDIVFNLAGSSSPTESLKNPNQGVEIINIFQNIINSLILNKNFCKFFQASSSEMFRDSHSPLDEKSEFLDNSPYAEAKISCHKEGLALSEKYEWPIISEILFNHESEFRKDNF